MKNLVLLLVIGMLSACGTSSVEDATSVDGVATEEVSTETTPEVVATEVVTTDSTVTE